MRFKVAAAAAMVGMLVVGASASLSLFRARPAGRLLTDAELAACLGGGCPQEDCEEQVCDTSQCLTQETQCKKKGSYCMMVEPTPFSKCVGGHKDKKCTHSSMVQACAQQYFGMQDMKGNCGPPNCGTPYTKCGPEKYQCMSEACDPND